MSLGKNVPSISYEIDQNILYRFPPSKFTYIHIQFYLKNNNIFPIENNIEDFSRVYQCYFIFQPNNWFHRNDIRRLSTVFSKDTYHKEFSVPLFYKNTIEKLLLAMVDENGKLHTLYSNEDKEKINTLILDFAVKKYIAESKPETIEVDTAKLSQDVHKYLRYQILCECGDSKRIPAGDPPQMPSALLLYSLIKSFPGSSLENILQMNEDVIQMMSIVEKQMDIAEFERHNVNESPNRTVSPRA